jgi:hypothetical protein
MIFCKMKDLLTNLYYTSIKGIYFRFVVEKLKLTSKSKFSVSIIQ